MRILCTRLRSIKSLNKVIGSSQYVLFFVCPSFNVHNILEWICSDIDNPCKPQDPFIILSWNCEYSWCEFANSSNFCSSSMLRGEIWCNFVVAFIFAWMKYSLFLALTIWFSSFFNISSPYCTNVSVSTVNSKWNQPFNYHADLSASLGCRFGLGFWM